VRTDRWTERHDEAVPFRNFVIAAIYKVLLIHAMKARRGSKGIAPLILDFGTRRGWLTSRPGKKYQYPLNLRLHGP
jgi:hypothetical protein